MRRPINTVDGDGIVTADCRRDLENAAQCTIWAADIDDVRLRAIGRSVLRNHQPPQNFISITADCWRVGAQVTNHQRDEEWIFICNHIKHKQFFPALNANFTGDIHG